jgi:hypothetical protein
MLQESKKYDKYNQVYMPYESRSLSFKQHDESEKTSDLAWKARDSASPLWHAVHV